MLDDILDEDVDEDDNEDGWVFPPLDSLARVRVMAEKCSTCIFRPGNRMSLQEGRVAGMLADVRAEDSYIPCHKTLGTGLPSAICRGGHEAHRGALARMAVDVLGGIVEVTEADVLAETAGGRAP